MPSFPWKSCHFHYYRGVKSKKTNKQKTTICFFECVNILFCQRFYLTFISLLYVFCVWVLIMLQLTDVPKCGSLFLLRRSFHSVQWLALAWKCIWLLRPYSFSLKNYSSNNAKHLTFTSWQKSNKKTIKCVVEIFESLPSAFKQNE